MGNAGNNLLHILVERHASDRGLGKKFLLDFGLKQDCDGLRKLMLAGRCYSLLTPRYTGDLSRVNAPRNRNNSSTPKSDRAATTPRAKSCAAPFGLALFPIVIMIVPLMGYGLCSSVFSPFFRRRALLHPIR